MFKFLEMANNYEERKVDNFTQGDIQVDTALINDSSKPYETGICHPAYNGGAWVIVELYNTKEEAQIGHDKWVKIMTSEVLPDTLKDVSTCEFINFRNALFGKEEIIYKKR